MAAPYLNEKQYGAYGAAALMQVNEKGVLRAHVYDCAPEPVA